MSGRRSCATRLAEVERRDAELLRLVGEIVLDACARKEDDADRQDIEDAVVSFERRGFAVTRPVGFESDLWHFAGFGPFGGDEFGALR